VRLSSWDAGLTGGRSVERLEKEAATPDLLVPITVDFDVPSSNPDVSGIKIKDRFLWNINGELADDSPAHPLTVERFITPEQFAQIFCDDVGIPASQYLQVVAELIQNQVEEAQRAVEIDVADRDVTENDVVWSEDEVEEETRETANGSGPAHVAVPAAPSSTPAPAEEDEAMEDEEADVVIDQTWKEADCRVIVNVSAPL
jgi:chromatin structure-remodeling complex subunit SFH1